jgi:acylphosphatase
VSSSAVRVAIWGRVQGVCFRAATREQAQLRALGGWVRNRSDGSVEAWFEGEPSQIEQMIAWCHRGPEYALVEHVEVTPVEPAGLTGFSVTR